MGEKHFFAVHTFISDEARRKVLTQPEKRTPPQKRKTKKEFEIILKGVFVQIGLVPNSSFVKDILDTSNYGEIIIDEHGNTSIEGIFACGDVTTIPYKQIVISMGEGAKTALTVSDYLMKDFKEVVVKEAV